MRFLILVIFIIVSFRMTFAQDEADPNLAPVATETLAAQPDQALRCSGAVPETQDQNLEQLGQEAQQRIEQRRNSRGVQ